MSRKRAFYLPKSATEVCIQGKSTVLQWLRKYGDFDWDNQTPDSISKVTQKIQCKCSMT